MYIWGGFRALYSQERAQDNSILAAGGTMFPVWRDRLQPSLLSCSSYSPLRCADKMPDLGAIL